MPAKRAPTEPRRPKPPTFCGSVFRGGVNLRENSSFIWLSFPGARHSGFVDSTGNAHVFVIDSNNLHVYQLTSGNGTAWTPQDVTGAVKGSVKAPVPATPLTTFADTYGYHVFFIAEDNSVHQLYFTNVDWIDQGITGKTSRPQVLEKSGLSGFVDSYGEHAFYMASNQHVHHMLYKGSWGDTDLTGTSDPDPPETAVPLAPSGSVSSFGDTYGDHCIYIGADQHVHQLYFENALPWVDQDLTLKATAYNAAAPTTAPPAATASALSSLANTYGEAIFYISADLHVHVLCYAPQPLGKVPNPTTTGPGTGPSVSCPPGTPAQVGVLYSATISPTGGSPGYTFKLSGGPDWLSLSPNSLGTSATLAGTPPSAAAAYYPYTLTVMDRNGMSASVNCGVGVAGILSIPSLSCPAGSGWTGVPYNSSLMTSGGTPPYTYQLLNGSGGLPPGMGLSPSTGAITGTPTQTGTYSFTVTVTDAAGETATNTCSITISAPFQIQAFNVAVTYSTGRNPGPPTITITPQLGLTFAIPINASQGPDANWAPTATLVNSTQGSSDNIYLITGVTNQDIVLSEIWYAANYAFCDSTGNTADIPQWLTVTLPQPNAPLTIYVGLANETNPN